MKSIKS